MNRSICRVVVMFAAVIALVGCKNKNTEPAHGSSTRQASALPQANSPTYVSFGQPTKLNDKDALPVTIVLADPAKYDGKYVRLVGNVSKVCQSKGCWLEMSDPSSNQVLFVKFTCPIEGRLIPLEAAGKPVVVEGYVKLSEISEADARHLKEESGATPDQVAQIKGPQKQITLASPSAQIAGL